MKKLVALIITICLVASLAIIFTSCSTYTSKEGSIDDIIGTYKLTKFTATNENDEAVDMIETSGVVAYITVNADGYGYYVYKDNDTETTIDSIAIEFNHDADNTDLYDSIKYNTGKSVSLTKQRPGAGEEPKMGVNVKKHTLNYTIPKTDVKIGKYEINIKSESVLYERVRKETDLDFIEKALNVKFPNIPRFELKNLSGVYTYQTYEKSVNANMYKYFVVEIDAVAMTFEYWGKFIDGTGEVHSEGDLILDLEDANAEKNILGTLQLGPTGIGVNFPIYKNSVSQYLAVAIETPTEDGNIIETTDYLNKIYLLEGKTIAEYCLELEQQYDQAHSQK